MDSPDFIVPPPGLIPAAPPNDDPDRTVRDTPPRALPVFSPPPGVVPFPGVVRPPVPPPASGARIATPGARPADGAWRLTGPGPLEVLLVRPVVLGRDPARDASRPEAATISLQDPARSVSKTHVLVEVVDDRVVITDLHSTNGTRLLTAAGEAHELEPGRAAEVPNGATVLLGEFAVRLDRVPRHTV